MATPKKRKILDLQTKHQILIDVDKRIQSKKKNIAEAYGIPQNSLSTLLKNRAQIEKAFNTGTFSPKRKYLRTANHSDIEEALFKWFHNVRDKNIPVNGPILSAKAEDLAKDLGYSDFKSSNGFIERFKKRRGISSKVSSGESSSVSEETVDEWKNKVGDIISNYTLDNVFNADETGLFFKLTPNRTLTVKGENCHGGKKSKERITLLVGANDSGTEKLKLLVIGKF
ncbi:tigger transposable element-derived protein 4-like [Pecten maximus]|uniref:tigger transposable element-derived protein 4-like n=1 Tax=Pecten maximus TaxID=6579 RepID=UPI0014583C8B|nr:tigger transposable element-derived protein 4-like [Pecten maximus]